MKHSINPKIFRALVLGFSLGCLCLSADIAGAASAPDQGSTRIVSEKMTYDSIKNQVVFEGKVHVTRPTMEIWSDFLTVVLDDSGKKKGSESKDSLGMSGGKVDRIIAERNVRIQQDTKVGTSGKATYFVNENRIVMEVNPTIIDGENKISGQTITYDTNTGRSVVVGSSSRKVEVLFTTDDKKSPALPAITPGEAAQ